MFQDKSGSSHGSDNESENDRVRGVPDRIRTKKTADYDRQHADYIRQFNSIPVRQLREEINRLNDRRTKMADELYEAGKIAAERASTLEPCEMERQLRLEKLEGKLQEARRKLIATIWEV